jgi:hypothetical protein
VRWLAYPPGGPSELRLGRHGWIVCLAKRDFENFTGRQGREVRTSCVREETSGGKPFVAYPPGGHVAAGSFGRTSPGCCWRFRVAKTGTCRIIVAHADGEGMQTPGSTGKAPSWPDSRTGYLFFAEVLESAYSEFEQGVLAE